MTVPFHFVFSLETVAILGSLEMKLIFFSVDAFVICGKDLFHTRKKSFFHYGSFVKTRVGTRTGIYPVLFLLDSANTSRKSIFIKRVRYNI